MEPRRPWIILGSFWRTKPVSSSLSPALTGKVPKIAGCCPVNSYLHIVKWLVLLAFWVNTTGILRAVLARIPSVPGQIDASYKGDRIVHHHDLLVVTGTNGVPSVEAEVNSAMTLPVELEHRE